MSDAYKSGKDHGSRGGPIPPQGTTPAQPYKDFVAGVRDSQKK